MSNSVSLAWLPTELQVPQVVRAHSSSVVREVKSRTMTMNQYYHNQNILSLETAIAVPQASFIFQKRFPDSVSS